MCLFWHTVTLNHLPNLFVHTGTVINTGKHVRNRSFLQLAVHHINLVVCLHAIDRILHLPKKQGIDSQVILVEHVAFDRTMPIILHADICDQKAGQLSVFEKRCCHKRTYIIYSEITDRILMFQKTVADLWYRKPLWIFQHGISDRRNVRFRHLTFGIVIKYMGTIFMVIDIQCTIQAEMIHKRIERILYHTLYVASVHINQFLPCGNKLHLSPGRCIIL